MGKIEALNAVDDEILRAVQRVERNTMSPSRTDILFLMEKYNENNTSGYTERDVTVCPDCRRHVFKFWQNVILQWKKTKR